MGRLTVRRAAALMVLAWGASSANAGLLFSNLGVKSVAGMAPTPVLVLGSDARRGAKEFAETHKIEIEQLKRAHAASGLVECGASHGAGQLTLSNNVITTAAHVFFDERGIRRAQNCDFIVESEGAQRRVQIDMASIVAGAHRPYAAKAVHDWAVAKLSHSVNGIEPYELATDLAVNEAVEFVARGHSDWGQGSVMSFEDCRLRLQTGQMKRGPREFAFDCNTGDGASGGAVLLGEDHRRLGAILVGWRSDDPNKKGSFSPTNYNFVVSIEGEFKRALANAASATFVSPGGAPALQHALSQAGPAGEETANRHRSLAPTQAR
jgi:hypothetical protein